MSVTRCSACLGKKTEIGLGMLERDCHVCNGVGYVKDQTETVNKKPDENEKQKRKGKKVK